MTVKQIKDNGFLKQQFAEIGFDLDDAMCAAAVKLSNRTILLSAIIKERCVSIQNVIPLVLFFVANPFSTAICYIEMIKIQLLKNVTGSYKYDILYENSFCSRKDPLPTKQQILNEMRQFIRAKNLEGYFYVKILSEPRKGTLKSPLIMN